MANYEDGTTFSIASGKDLPYIVLQVTLKEKLLGTGSENLVDLEDVVNDQFRKGYRLISMSTANGGSKGLMGGDRIQSTLVFEKINIEAIYYQIQEAQQDKEVDEQDTLSAESSKQEEQWICIKCNTRNSENANYCVECDEIRHFKWKCMNCGVINEARTKYCFNCGKARARIEEILPDIEINADQTDENSLPDPLPEVERLSLPNEIIEFTECPKNSVLTNEDKNGADSLTIAPTDIKTIADQAEKNLLR